MGEPLGDFNSGRISLKNVIVSLSTVFVDSSEIIKGVRGTDFSSPRSAHHRDSREPLVPPAGSVLLSILKSSVPDVNSVALS